MSAYLSPTALAHFRSERQPSCPHVVSNRARNVIVLLLQVRQAVGLLEAVALVVKRQPILALVRPYA